MKNTRSKAGTLAEALEQATFNGLAHHEEGHFIGRNWTVKAVAIDTKASYQFGRATFEIYKPRARKPVATFDAMFDTFKPVENTTFELVGIDVYGLMLMCGGWYEIESTWNDGEMAEKSEATETNDETATTETDAASVETETADENETTDETATTDAGQAKTETGAAARDERRRRQKAGQMLQVMA